jgi:hypothetical protein
VGIGEDGGLDRGASSDHTAGESFGLDVRGSEDSRKASGSSFGDTIVGASVILEALGSGVRSTRLRLVGGSSS